MRSGGRALFPRAAKHATSPRNRLSLFGVHLGWEHPTSKCGSCLLGVDGVRARCLRAGQTPRLPCVPLAPPGAGTPQTRAPVGLLFPLTDTLRVLSLMRRSFNRFGTTYPIKPKLVATGLAYFVLAGLVVVALRVA